MFWFHFYSATERGSLNAEWARETAVEEMDLQNLSEDEAGGFLELVSEGAYTREDIPEHWLSIFEKR